jgi:hypothetical protein
MRLSISLLFSLLFLFSCGDKVKDVNTDEDIASVDFVAAFQDTELPVMFNQAELAKKESDSFFIKAKTVLKFVPDSIFKDVFGKTSDLKFYRKGKYIAETKETYLFLVAERKEKKSAYIICFNEELNYSAAMELVHKSSEPETSLEGGIDKKLTVIKTRSKQTKDGKALYNKSAYVYNTEGLFTLILTESNEPVEEAVVYNPIDTFSTKEPLSGDYLQDKKNFVSVRDGGKPGKLLFFLTLSKKTGSCEGSLRGDMTQVKPKVFQYNKADDHCIIEFTFSKNNLQVKELEACGNHRGIRCSFDGSYKKSNLKK